MSARPTPSIVAVVTLSLVGLACSSSENTDGSGANPEGGGVPPGGGGSSGGSGGTGYGGGGGSMGGGGVVVLPDGGTAGIPGGNPWDGPVIVGDGSIGTTGNPPAGAVVMTVDTSGVRTLPAAFHGYNYCGYWDGNQGSAGSAAGLGRIGMELTRFPGGVPGMFYRWYDPYQKDPKSNQPMSTTSLNDLWAYAQKIRPDEAILFETNPTTNGGNDPSGAKITELMNKLKTDGINIKYFEIGNEPDMGDTSGMAPAAYFAAFNEQAKAIHAACSDCIVMGPSVFTFWQAGNTWLDDFVKNCGDNADAISVHSYGEDNTVDGGNPSPGGWWGPKDRLSSKLWLDRYNLIRQKTQKPIYVTEWTTDRDPGSYHLGGKVAGALADADVIGSMAHTPGLAGYTIFGTVHTIWTSYGLFGDQGWAEGQVFSYKASPNDAYNIGDYLDANVAMVPMLHMWASVMGRKVFDLANTGDVANVNGWAHGRGDGSIQVMLINKQETPADARVSFSSFDPTGHKVNIHELRGLNGKAWDCPAPDKDCTHYFYNGVAEAQLGDRTRKAADGGVSATIPGSVPPPVQVSCTGPKVDRTLPPLSITVLDFLP
jgi:hypothetical protein